MQSTELYSIQIRALTHLSHSLASMRPGARRLTLGADDRLIAIRQKWYPLIKLIVMNGIEVSFMTVFYENYTN